MTWSKRHVIFVCKPINPSFTSTEKFVLNEDTELAFTNNKNTVVDTGVNRMNVILVAATGALMLGAVVFLLKKRRR